MLVPLRQRDQKGKLQHTTIPTYPHATRSQRRDRPRKMHLTQHTSHDYRSLFNHTTAQRLREGLTAAAGRQGVLDLDILEPERDDTILNVNDWGDIMTEVTFDSGACRHVMSKEVAPGYPLHDSADCRRGLGSIVGNTKKECPTKGSRA